MPILGGVAAASGGMPSEDGGVKQDTTALLECILGVFTTPRDKFIPHFSKIDHLLIYWE
jgi:hypothetical protein